jgi:hypothetical protein
MAQRPKTHLPITGSDREPLEGATRFGPADPSEQIEVTVLLRPKQKLAAGARLTHEELEAAPGADPQDIARVQAFVQEHNLAVGEIDPGRRTVELSGTVEYFSKAFAVQLDRYQHASGQYRGRTGQVSKPADLAPAGDEPLLRRWRAALEVVQRGLSSIVNVDGLDGRPYRLASCASAGLARPTLPQNWSSDRCDGDGV